jgi:D-glycero-D-manno-heptose 1,7-bisphosphate phosphatase
LSDEKAVFLDRDGTLTEMVYYPEHGLVDSPFVPSQVRLIEGVGRALRDLAKRGYRLVVISNQPGVAKKHFSMQTFGKMTKKMENLLGEEKVGLDAQYYCFHHPQARVPKYRMACSCRKPKPGLIFRAAKERGISLSGSVMIGDGITDVVAGRRAGVQTVLLSNLNYFVSGLMTDMDAVPDFVARTMGEAAEIVEGLR